LAGRKVAEIGGYPATFHVRDFLDCVKSRAQPRVNAQVACQRMIAGATAPLLKAADAPDAPVRAAALAALGATVELGDLPVLIARVTNPKDPEEATAASKALSAACQRMPDQDACAEKLLGAMPKASVAAKRGLLEVLAALGGAKALQAVAQKVGGKAVDLNKVLAEVGHRPMKSEILKAEYGEGSQVKDVTAVVRQCARDFPVIALPSPDYNSSFGGDPAPGVVKQLKIQYRMTGKKGEATFQENATILLPMPK
jgi:hypothetical protein